VGLHGEFEFVSMPTASSRRHRRRLRVAVADEAGPRRQQPVTIVQQSVAVECNVRTPKKGPRPLNRGVCDEADGRPARRRARDGCCGRVTRKSRARSRIVTAEAPGYHACFWSHPATLASASSSRRASASSHTPRSAAGAFFGVRNGTSTADALLHDRHPGCGGADPAHQRLQLGVGGDVVAELAVASSDSNSPLKTTRPTPHQRCRLRPGGLLGSRVVRRACWPPGSTP